MMKYFVAIAIFVSLISLGFNLKTYKPPIQNQVATLDMQIIVKAVNSKFGQQIASKSLSQEEQKKLIKQLTNEAKMFLNEFSKTKNILIVDKKLVLTTNLQDLTDEFIDKFYK